MCLMAMAITILIKKGRKSCGDMNYRKYQYRDSIRSRERQFWERLRVYFPRLYRVDLRSESYATLNNILTEVDSAIKDTKVKMAERDELETQIAKLDEEIKPLDEKHSEMLRKSIDARGLLADIFGMAPSQKEKDLAAQAAKMGRIIEPLKEQRRRLASRKSQLAWLDINLELFVWYRRKVEPLAVRRKDTEDAWIQLRNKAATNSVQIREVADIVKERIGKQDFCPYCGGDLGESPHADHIYPVSKGGRSTIKNMVYVCASCNMAKLDMTLSTFIRTYNLDRDEIEKRLADMGKEF